MYCIFCYKKLNQERTKLLECLTCKIYNWFDNIPK